LGASAPFAFAAEKGVTAVGVGAGIPERTQRAIALLSGWAVGSEMREAAARMSFGPKEV